MSVIRIAQVGADNPLSEEDEARTCAAMGVVYDVGGDAWTLRADEEDVINLNDGRDFLMEREQYDVVILHGIFDGRPVAEEDVTPEDWAQVRTSPLHSRDRWLARLAATGAEWVIVCGGQPVSLWLGEVPGYDTVHQPDERITVFRRR